MNCPFCKIPSMRTVTAGGREIDRCTTCGALWFDEGEIRALTDGHVPQAAAGAEPGRGDGAAPADDRPGAPGKRAGAALRRMHRVAGDLSCPRCGARVVAIDFHATSIPVFLCLGCRGYLAPRTSAAAIHACFEYVRAHKADYEALGDAMAEEFRKGMELRGPLPAPPGRRPQIPLPILVPLRDNAPAPESYPLVTCLLIALWGVLFLFYRVAEAPLRLPGGLPGLPSGSGVGTVPAAAILAAPFLHAAILPLVIGVLFLAVLGDNVEDRIGRTPYAVLYLLCGAAAGVAHIAWGTAGNPAALGSAGAVAGVLGAYLVFFPQVSITMYGMGRLVSLPAYLFACAWIFAAFLIGPGPIMNFFNPAPLSFAGNIAGFATGVAAAIVWRLFEDSTAAGARPA